MVLVPWCALALLSLALWRPGGWPEWLVPEVAALLLLILALPGRRRAIVLLLPLLAGLLQAQRALETRMPPEVGARDVLVRGQVCDFPRDGGKALNFVLLADGLGNEQAARLQLAWYEPAVSPRAGETWELLVRVRATRGLASPGARDTERLALVNGLSARGYVRDSRLNRRLARNGWRCPTMLVRRWVAERVQSALAEHPAAAHLLALTVGARYRLQPADWELLRATGTTHLMAISGLHVGLVAGAALFAGRALAYLLLRVRVPVAPRLLALTLALLAAAVYAALAGFALPTRRALLMLLAWIVLSGRGVDSWTTLSIALWLVILTDGLAVLTPGLWLSFGAVVALLSAALACPVRNRAGGWGARVATVGTAQWRVFLGLLPVTALSFGVLAPVSPLANFVAVPLFAIAIMPLTLVGGLLTILGLSPVPLRFAGDLLQLLLTVLQWLSIETWTVPPPPTWLIPLVLVATAMLLWPRPLPGRALACPWLLLAVGLRPVAPAPGEFSVQVLDVGQGLAVVIQTHGHTLLYDSGPAYGASDAGRLVVLPALRAAGVTRLDAIIISHGDLDHAGGLPSLEAVAPRAPVFAPVPRAVAVPSQPCRRGQRWTWDGVSFRMLHPTNAFLRGRSNNRSCVLLVQSATAAVLLPGDIGRGAEVQVADLLPPQGVDLVVAPHHGSATSSSPALVAASRPRYVVFTAGYRNRWAFPRPAVVTRWRHTGACLLTTAGEGSLRFEMRAGRLVYAHGQRRDAARGWTMPPEHRACELDDTTL